MSTTNMAASILLSSSSRIFSQIIRLNTVRCIQKQKELNMMITRQQPTQIFTIFRCYAKGKDRKKDRQKNVVINENMLSGVIKLDDLRSQLARSVEKMKEDFVKNLTLRTSLGALDTLEVDFEGTTYGLQDVAQIGKKGTNLYVIDLSSFPQLIPNVVKAIQMSGMGLNPQQDGTRLYIPVPKITKEHRETLSKNAKAVFVRTKDELRAVQNKFIKGLKNKEGISEDVVHSAKEQITSIADQFIAEAEEVLKMKQTELTL